MVFGNLLGGNSNPSKENKKSVVQEDAAATTTNKPGYRTTPGAVALVTGSSGFCGARLVEMLLERGAAKVICFDVMPPSDDVLRQRFEQVQANNRGELVILSNGDGDVTNADAVDRAFASVPKIDVCYHIAALVGPFHDRAKYMAVNYQGTLNIIEACRKHKVPKLVNSSSPSTRFTGKDICGLREDEMPIPDKFLELYAETKAMAEREVTKACDGDKLLTVSVAPHQVYGPHDSLMLPKLLETSGNGRLRIFGKGDNLISFCYVDNYCHGLMCGADALYKGNSSVLGKFYIVTDEGPRSFWKAINQAGLAMGFQDLESKFHLPYALLYVVAHVCQVLGYLLNKKFKLNPFTLKMLTIHRYFSIENAKRDLKYEPEFEFETQWKETIEWFKIHWLPKFLEETGRAGAPKPSNSSKAD